jgi:chromosome partitioning protein
MGKIVAVCGLKGGAGKSTLSVLVSGEAAARGKDVLLADADTDQKSALRWSERAAANKQRVPTCMLFGENLASPANLPRLAPGFDLTVVDCPPRLKGLQKDVMALADLLILPCGPTGFDIEALGETLDLVRAAHNARPALKSSVVLTRMLSGQVLSREARGLIAPSGATVMEPTLGFRASVARATTDGYTLDAWTPRDAAYAELQAICKEIGRLLRGDDGKEKGPVRGAQSAQRPALRAVSRTGARR